jgi:uncharacterized membrane protein YfcA
LAVVLAIGAVLIYIWLRFEWQFALGAVAALVHDVVLTIGVFSELQIKFDLAIIAALLTIVGYSLNDTVVVFDRVRENLRKYKKKPLAEVLNISINETLSRTVMTSVTTLLALTALFVLGGDVIRGFVFAMIWGVIVGTYSSVFGTAMIYLPFAAQVVPPLWAILTLMAMDLIGPIPLIKPAFKDAQRRDLLLLLGGSLCLLPVGLALLSTISPETYRYLVSSISIVLLVCLVFGLRYSGKMYPPLVAAVGGLAGFSGGLGGVPGPPVILFYMASTLPVRVVRANMMLFLFFTDILIISVVGIRGE